MAETGAKIPGGDLFARFLPMFEHRHSHAVRSRIEWMKAWRTAREVQGKSNTMAEALGWFSNAVRDGELTEVSDDA